MTEKFDKYSTQGNYHWSTTNRFNIVYNAPLVSRYESVLKRIPAESKTIIDFGSGDGYLSCRVAQRFPNATVTGLEYEASGVAIAEEAARQRSLDNVGFVCNQSTVISIDTGTVDVVAIADVIEHLEEVDVILRELHRILRPGGLMIVTTPNRQKGVKWDPRHICEYTGSELRDALLKNFADVQVFGSWPMRYVNRWRRKRFGRAALDLMARLGVNLFDEELQDPGPEFGQLTAVAHKAI